MIADGLVGAGARVCIVSRSSGDCAQAVEELTRDGGAAFAIPADLSDPAEVARVAAEFGEREETLHILVNNAATMVEAPLEEFPATEWDRVLNLNLRTPFLLVQALLPMLEAAGTLDDPARVINVGSIDGIKPPFLDTFPYPASKAALHHLTRHLSRTLGPRGISVNAIAPGAFPTRNSAPILKEHLQDFIDSTPLARIGRPEDMAGTAVYMASQAGAFLNGSIITLDGGLSA